MKPKIRKIKNLALFSTISFLSVFPIGFLLIATSIIYLSITRFNFSPFDVIVFIIIFCSFWLAAIFCLMFSFISRSRAKKIIFKLPKERIDAVFPKYFYRLNREINCLDIYKLAKGFLQNEKTATQCSNNASFNSDNISTDEIKKIVVIKKIVEREVKVYSKQKIVWYYFIPIFGYMMFLGRTFQESRLVTKGGVVDSISSEHENYFLLLSVVLTPILIFFNFFPLIYTLKPKKNALNDFDDIKNFKSVFEWKMLYDEYFRENSCQEFLSAINSNLTRKQLIEEITCNLSTFDFHTITEQKLLEIECADYFLLTQLKFKKKWLIPIYGLGLFIMEHNENRELTRGVLWEKIQLKYRFIFLVPLVLSLIISIFFLINIAVVIEMFLIRRLSLREMKESIEI